MKRSAPMRRQRAVAAPQERHRGFAAKKRSRVGRASKVWLEAKARVLARANGKCEFCVAARPLDVHHVIKRSHFGKKNEAVAHCPRTNLIALCRPCHDATDAPYDAIGGRLVIIHVVVKNAHGYDCELIRSTPIDGETGRQAYLKGQYETLAWNYVRAEGAA